MSTALPQAVTFESVLKDELEQLKHRRSRLKGHNPDSSASERVQILSTCEVDVAQPTSEAEVYEAALNSDLCALAISGGGIRSATFGLGIIQGLAVSGLLQRFDYLSTVSGGGYIGSWLTAWIHRTNLKQVVEELHPPRFLSTADFESVQQKAQFENYAHEGNPVAQYGQRSALPVTPNSDRDQAGENSKAKAPDLVPGPRAEATADASGAQGNGEGGGANVISDGPAPSQSPPLANRAAVRLPKGLWAEPAAIRHLRFYSNYLSPRMGIFSTDGWVLIAIYLRNLLLNQFVLLLAVMSLFLFARSVVEFVSVFRAPFDSEFNSSIAAVAAVATLLLALGMTIALSCRDRLHTSRSAKPPPISSVWLVAACCGSLLFVTHGSQVWFAGRTLFTWMCAAVAAMHAALAFSTFIPRSVTGGDRWFFGRGLAALVLGAAGGATAGLLLYGVLYVLTEVSTRLQIKVAAFVTFGPPIFLVCYVLGNFIQVGLSRLCYEPYEREWWSSLNARLLRVSAGWLLAIGLTIFGPWLVALLLREYWRGFPGVMAMSTWITATAAGLWAAQSPQTGFPQPNWKDWLARIAPLVFLVGLLLIVSFGTTWLGYRVHGFTSGTDVDFFGTYVNRELGALLYELETPTEPVFPWRTFGISVYFDRPISGIQGLLLAFFVCILLWSVLGTLIGVNAFSLHDLYALRLVRCYLGATNADRRPDPFTNLDPYDDMELAELQHSVQKSYDGPFLIINGALNRKIGELVPGQEAESLAFQERKAESFSFTPRYSGSVSTGYVPTAQFAGNLRLGTAMAVSGAAVSPNMGFHSSPAVTALLTVFNMRLGAWLGNPKKPYYDWTSPSVSYLLEEMLGMTGINREFVYVSDGGHFETMGVYELVRRRCRFIVAIDSGADPNFLRQNLGHMIRKIRIDLGVRIELDVDETRPIEGFAKTHVSVGRIFYNDVHQSDRRVPPSDPQFDYEANHGILVYLKLGLTGDEPTDLLNFQAENRLFPNEPTLDQFYGEAQFESYRAIGVHTALTLVEGVLSANDVQNQPAATNRVLFHQLYTRWMPRPPGLNSEYLDCNVTYAAIQEKLRCDRKLQSFAWELCGNKQQKQHAVDHSGTEERKQSELAERLMLIEMMTLLENAYLSLALDRHLYHPYNIGWWRVLYNWKHTSAFRKYWPDIECEFSQVFRDFIRSLKEPPLNMASEELEQNANPALKPTGATP